MEGGKAVNHRKSKVSVITGKLAKNTAYGVLVVRREINVMGAHGRLDCPLVAHFCFRFVAGKMWKRRTALRIVSESKAMRRVSSAATPYHRMLGALVVCGNHFHGGAVLAFVRCRLQQPEGQRPTAHGSGAPQLLPASVLSTAWQQSSVASNMMKLTQ